MPEKGIIAPIAHKSVYTRRAIRAIGAKVVESDRNMVAFHQSGQIMFVDTHSVDIGNRFVKTVELDGSVAKKPSHLLLLDADSEIKGTEESPLVTVIEGNQKITYVIGSKAQRNGGQSNLHELDKIVQFKYFLLASLPAHPILEINELLVAVPDSRFTPHQLALKELVGTHQYVRNGKQQIVKIRSVRLIDEVKGAFAYAVNQKLFGLPHELNAVWSCGGGDFCASLLLDGDIVQGSKIVLKKGTLELANMIAAKKKSQVQTNLDPIDIMDAIAEGIYQTYKGGDFSSVFRPCLDKWIKDITGEIGIAWKKELPLIRQTLIVGGSTPWFYDYRESKKNKAKWILCPQAQDAIVLGLKHA
jgi:Actin like proteins N terminal domain